MITWILVILLMLMWCYILVDHHSRRARVMLAGLPTFSYLPLIGNMHHFFGGTRVAFQRIVDLSKISEHENLPFVIWAGVFPAICLNDPDDVKTMTNAFVEKPYYYSFGRIWLGNGLLLAPGSIWKKNIKKLAGTFNAVIVDSYQQVFNTQAHKLVQKLKKEAGAAPFNVLDKYLAYTTLETICQTALGMSDMSESIVTEEYYNAFSKALQLFIRRGLNLFLHLDFIYHLTPMYKELKKCIAILHNVSDVIITKRINDRKERKHLLKLNQDMGTGSGGVKFKPFLDILLDLSESDSTFTPEQIKGEVDTIILGGQETVATTVFYILLMVGCNPGVQKKLQEEMKEIFDGDNRPVNKDDLAKMSYSEAVINETLRMFPPVPMLMRHAEYDLKIKSCTIPKGANCIINAWGLGRSCRAWGPDASQYRPERWLEPDCPAFPSAFLAFSYGRRACIGKKYAMAILKTILAYCVRELEFVSEADKMEFKVDLALRPVSGHLIQVKLRE